MKIGIFDSGTGGLNVLAYAEKHYGADYIYYADCDNVPYGTKTVEEIIRLSENAVDYLLGKGAEAVVIACNTATSAAAEVLRKRYKVPIIGMEPAVKPAAEHHPEGGILVCATPLTIQGERLHSLITRVCHEEPELVPMPELVTFAENLEFEKETVFRYLDSLLDRRDYRAVVLGCTHFSYFRDIFAEYFADAEILDGTEGTVRHMCDILGAEKAAAHSTATYSVSGREPTDTEMKKLDSLYVRALKFVK